MSADKDASIKMNVPLLLVDVSLWLLLVVPVLALGGVHRATIAGVAFLSAMAMGLLWWSYRAIRRSLQVPWFGWVLLGVSAYTALQLVPLPLGLLERIAPATAATLRVSWSALGLPRYHPISLNSAATLLEVAKLGACALALIIAHNRLQQRERRRILFYSFVGLAGLLVVFGLIGAIVAPGQALLFYKQTTGSFGQFSGLIATSFVNPNHSAAFLGLGALLAVSFTLTASELRQRAFWGLGATLLGGGVFLTLSRGGILALAFGMLALGGLLWVVRRKEHGEWHPVYLPLLFAVIFGFAGWLALDALRGELQRSVVEVHAGGMGKLQLWPSGWAMLADNAFVGTGRGAFLTAFPRFAERGGVSSTVVFSHIENQYLQLPIELGVPIGGGLIVVSALALLLWVRKGVLGAGSAAAAAGLLLLAAHNVVDFNLELLGIALPAALLAGSLSAAGANRGGTRTRRRRFLRYFRAILLATAILGVAVAALLAWRFGESSVAAAMRLADWRPSDLSVEAVKARMAREIRGRPADYLPHLIIARRIAKEGDPLALRSLNRALYLNPRSAAIHLEAMRLLLLLRRRPQAFVEGRLALDYSGDHPWLAAWVFGRCRAGGEIESLVRNRPKRGLAAASFFRPRGRIVDALSALRVELREHPKDRDTALAEVETLLFGARRREEEMSQREAWAAEALRRGKTLVERIDAAEAYVLYATALTLAGSSVPQNPKPSDVLEKGFRRFPRSRDLVLALGHAYVHEKRTADARILADRLMKEPLDRRLRARVHILLSAIYRAEGRLHRAAYEMQRARALSR